MEDGFYWLIEEGRDPRVVEISLDSMYHIGGELSCDLVDGNWFLMGEPFEFIDLIGPIKPPVLKHPSNQKAVFIFTLNGKAEKRTLKYEENLFVSLNHEDLKHLAGLSEFECTVSYELENESGGLYPGDYKHFKVTDHPKITVTKA